jgi:DNA-binding NarL/FixJ family response regulator
MEVVATAADGQEAVTLTERYRPDVIVMDISMPVMDGLRATEEIQDLDFSTCIVILSLYTDGTVVRQALKKGASGIVTKQKASDDLPRAIRTVLRGQRFFSPSIVAAAP